MNYYEQNDRRGRVWGILGIVLYLVVCAGVMFITYRIALPDKEEYILVELSEDEARPSATLSGSTAAETPTAAESASEVEETVVSEPVMTAEDGKPVREVNQRALFRGSATGNSSTQTETQASGGGGNDSPNGGVGGEYSLGGRGLGGDGRLPMPAYNIDEEGRVVISITVNRDGVVTNAVYQPAGSNTNNGELVSAARAAALRAKFVTDENAPEIQRGTITYNFRLN